MTPFHLVPKSYSVISTPDSRVGDMGPTSESSSKSASLAVTPSLSLRWVRLGFQKQTPCSCSCLFQDPRVFIIFQSKPDALQGSISWHKGLGVRDPTRPVATLKISCNYGSTTCKGWWRLCNAALVRGFITLSLQLTFGPAFPFPWTEAT